MKQAADEVTEDGVKQFAEAFDKLLAAVGEHGEGRRIIGISGGKSDSGC
jgi:hypothetical protein